MFVWVCLCCWRFVLFNSMVVCLNLSRSLDVCLVLSRSLEFCLVLCMSLELCLDLSMFPGDLLVFV